MSYRASAEGRDCLSRRRSSQDRSSDHTGFEYIVSHFDVDAPRHDQTCQPPLQQSPDKLALRRALRYGSRILRPMHNSARPMALGSGSQEITATVRTEAEYSRESALSLATGPRLERTSCSGRLLERLWVTPVIVLGRMGRRQDGAGALGTSDRADFRSGAIVQVPVRSQPV